MCSNPSTARLDAGALFRRHAAFVESFLARRGFVAADVDDLVQEVFVVAHRRGGFVAGLVRPTTWLASIALRVAWSARRRERRDVGRSRSSGAEGVFASGVAQLEARDALRRIDRSLERLSPYERRLVIGSRVEGCTASALALREGRPLSTVHDHLRAACQDFDRRHASLRPCGAARDRR